MKNLTEPADLARQTLIQLAKNSLPPTPENYAATYKGIAGSKAIDAPSVNKTLQKVLIAASKQNPQYEAAEKVIAKAVKKQDWTTLEKEFQKLFSNTTSNDDASNVNWSALIRTLLKQLETSHKGITLSRKKEGLSRVLRNFAKKPVVLAEKVQALMRAWGNEVSTVDAYDSNDDLISNQQQTGSAEGKTVASVASNSNTNNKDTGAAQSRDMMIRTLDLALIPLLKDASIARKKAEALLRQLRNKNAGERPASHVHD